MSTSTPESFVVAHRAGNDIERLRAAERLRVPLVEADVHLFGGRLEVRHRKTVGVQPRHVHTLNGTAVTWRHLIALLENHGTAVPDVLVQWGAPAELRVVGD